MGRLARAATNERFNAAEAGLLAIRLAVVGGNLATYLLFFDDAGIAWLAWAMTLGSASLALFLFLSHRKGPQLDGPYAPLILVSTTVLIGAWVFATGGYESPYYLLYFLAMFAIAMGLEPRLALVSTGVYAASYVAIVGASGGLPGHGAEMLIRVIYIVFAGLLSARHARVFGVWVRTTAEMGDRAAQAEHASERFRQYLESAPDAVAIAGSDGRIVHANTQCQELFGYAPEALIGKPIEVLIPERFRMVHVMHRSAFMERPRNRPMGAGADLFGLRADGSEFPVEISLAPMAIDGEMMVSASVRDVTLRKRIEQQVYLLKTVPLAMEAEQDDRAALSRALEIVCKATGWDVAHAWRRGDDGRLVLVGAWQGEAHAPSLLHEVHDPVFRPEDGLPGLLWREQRAVWIPDIAQDRRLTSRFKANGPPLRAGAGIPVHGDEALLAGLVFYIAQPRDDDERFVEILSAVATQIGLVLSRKHADAEAASARRESDEVQRLRELNTFKTTLINTAAHELYTPLTPIKLQLHRLRGPISKMGPTETRSLDILERNVDRLTLLVQDVLEVARLQSGRLRVDLQPMELQPVLVEAFEAFEEMARARSVQLALKPAAAAAVRADGKRLSHVLFNLLSNAIKFTPAGGVVALSARAEGPEVVVCVEDSGIGIAAADIGRMFEPFSPVHESAGRAREGTGLGLYIAKGIVELHGGRIWVESDGPGRGSRFFFTLPVIAPEMVSVRPIPQAPERERASALARRARELI